MYELVYLKPQNVFPIEDGDIPASYVSLPEGNCQFLLKIPHLEPQIQPVLKVAGWKWWFLPISHVKIRKHHPIDSQLIKKCLTFGYQVYNT